MRCGWQARTIAPARACNVVGFDRRSDRYCNSDLSGRLLVKLHQSIEISAEATAGLKPRRMVGYFDR
jgi:hypothetical protein